MEKEVWKSIKNYEGLYEVSSLGRVKSLSRFVNAGRGYVIKERILKPITDKHGYINVGLCIKKYKVHQLVAIAFLNHTPCKYELLVDHINDVKSDNRLVNLQIVTNRFNVCKTQGNYLSKYKGVSWDKTKNKWVSRIRINGINKFIGLFNDEFEASMSYQNKLKEYGL